MIRLGRLIITWKRQFSYKADVAYVYYGFLPIIVVWVVKKTKAVE